MRLASIVLAALLQVLPVGRLVLAGPVAAPSSMAIVFTWLAGAAALLGSYHAVSGASAAIAGLVKYNGATPVGTPTNYVVEASGQVFKYRITVSNPGVDFDRNYFNCIPLPPGLTINTNPGAAGYITGTPTAAGAYAVTLVAGNLNYPTPATAPATLVIFPPNTPPAITNQPRNQSVVTGTNVSFTVAATGSLPLAYRWTFNGAALPGKTAPTLTLTNVTTAQAGDYRAVITNAFGSVTSSVARLTIREPFVVNLRLGGPLLTNDAFRFEVTGPIYTNYVIWRCEDFSAWTPIWTNWVIDGYLEFSDPGTASRPARFYRASLAR